jgi:hypothetical protein
MTNLEPPNPFVIDHETAMTMVVRASSLRALPLVASGFAKEGFLGSVPHDYKLRRLKKVMGSTRYQQAQNIQAERDKKMAEGRFNEAPTENALYLLLNTADEAHCFYSIQLETSQAANAVAYEAVIKDLPPESVVADLGCFTGSFARLIASEHPSLVVHGLDHLPNLIAIANSTPHPPNVTFEVWNYTAATSCPQFYAQALTSVLSLPLSDLLAPGDFGGLPKDSREAPVYAKALELARTAASNWAKIATPDASLCVVARAGTPPLILAIAEGCQQAGWQLRKQSTRVVRTSEEAVPCFVFDRTDTPQPCTALSNEEATAIWFAGLLA